MNKRLYVFDLLIYFSDEQFLKTHSISADKSLKLFVRVKERIVPDRCSYRITQKSIEIILIKENPNSTKWGRLEPSEYSESRPPIQQTSPTTSPSSPISGKGKVLFIEIDRYLDSSIQKTIFQPFVISRANGDWAEIV
jgi:hypothetical protein